MILTAKKEFNIDLTNSILIGDKISNIEAGKNAGIGINILFNLICFKFFNSFLYPRDEII